MEFNLMARDSRLAQTHAARGLMQCNEFTAHFGLTLSQDQAVALVERRGRALGTSGRVEFGQGVIKKLIRAFCDSPYLGQDDYVYVMEALIEIFYAFKNETLDRMTDDALIGFMAKAFNGSCGGSLALLEERELTQMAENLRRGLRPDAADAPETLDEDEVDPYGGA